MYGTLCCSDLVFVALVYRMLIGALSPQEWSVIPSLSLLHSSEIFDSLLLLLPHFFSNSLFPFFVLPHFTARAPA